MKQIDWQDLVMTDDYEYLHEGLPFTGVAVRVIYGVKVEESTFSLGSP